MTISQTEQLFLLTVRDWELEEAAKKAAATIAKIDISALPFLTTLSLVKWDDIPNHLKPAAKQLHAIKIETVSRDINRPHASPMTVQTNASLDVFSSEQKIEGLALDLIFFHLRHEMAELIKVDGVRKLDPHASSAYANVLTRFDFNFYNAVR